jgi:hypothetical protein
MRFQGKRMRGTFKQDTTQKAKYNRITAITSLGKSGVSSPSTAFIPSAMNLSFSILERKT